MIPLNYMRPRKHNLKCLPGNAGGGEGAEVDSEFSICVTGAGRVRGKAQTDPEILRFCKNQTAPDAAGGVAARAALRALRQRAGRVRRLSCSVGGAASDGAVDDVDAVVVVQSAAVQLDAGRLPN